MSTEKTPIELLSESTIVSMGRIKELAELANKSTKSLINAETKARGSNVKLVFAVAFMTAELDSEGAEEREGVRLVTQEDLLSFTPNMKAAYKALNFDIAKNPASVPSTLEGWHRAINIALTALEYVDPKDKEKQTQRRKLQTGLLNAASRACAKMGIESEQKPEAKIESIPYDKAEMIGKHLIEMLEAFNAGIKEREDRFNMNQFIDYISSHKEQLLDI